jgi:hypothetical protein
VVSESDVSEDVDETDSGIIGNTIDALYWKDSSNTSPHSKI